MGNLVFQATLGGQVNLVGPNTGSTFNLNVPAVSSTIATLTGTETFTNKTLTSPTLTTPVLGTPASGTLTNCTSLPVGGITATGTPSSTTFLRGDSSWATITATTPGGSTTQLQYNNAGAFGGISGVTTDGTRMTASTTIGVGGATPSTSGAGISFPATQSASSDANTLDDYEKGTFTPTMSSASGGPVVLSTALGQYTKIGNVVNFRLRVTVSNANAASGTININGLPFTCSSTIACRNRVVAADVSNFTGNTMDSIGGTFIGNGGTSIQMLNSVFANVVLTNTSSADIVGTYFAA